MTTLKHIILSVLILLLPGAASAATISLRATPATIGTGDIVRVSVLLDSAISTNAFSGNVVYSADTLEPIAANDGSSIISLWITHPEVPVSSGPISFAGITPGGFSGNGGLLFSLLFRAKVAGQASVTLKDIQVLRNDGSGGSEVVTLTPLRVSIGTKSTGGYGEPEDMTPPEPFTAYLGGNPEQFGGQSYLVFMAVDKNSGIDHYAVAESRLPSFLRALFPLAWKTTVSPYLMADQNLTNSVFVKAVDRAGNERLSVFPPQHLFTTYEKSLFLGILIILVLLLLSLKRRRLGKTL